MVLAVRAGGARDEVNEGGAIAPLLEDELSHATHRIALGHAGDDLAKEPLPGPAGDRGRLAHAGDFFRRLHHAQAHDQVAGVHEARLRQCLHDGQVVPDRHAHALLVSELRADSGRAPDQVADRLDHHCVRKPLDGDVAPQIPQGRRHPEGVGEHLSRHRGRLAFAGEHEHRGSGAGVVVPQGAGAAGEVLEVLLSGDEEGVELLFGHRRSRPRPAFLDVGFREGGPLRIVRARVRHFGSVRRWIQPIISRLPTCTTRTGTSARIAFRRRFRASDRPGVIGERSRSRAASPLTMSRAPVPPCPGSGMVPANPDLAGSRSPVRKAPSAGISRRLERRRSLQLSQVL